VAHAAGSCAAAGRRPPAALVPRHQLRLVPRHQRL